MSILRVKSHLTAILAIMVFLLPVRGIAAPANFSVSPLIIDITTEGRDIITRDITLTNHSQRQTRVYASVHEIAVGEDTEIKEFITPSMTDRATSITSWLEISRARMEVPAASTHVVPLTIRVHPNTPPGTYHALVGFASGANRDDIEAQIKNGQGESVILKITIEDKRREQLHLVNFTTSRFAVKKDGNYVSFTLENTGDTLLKPEGEVVIYDTTGRELAAVSVNAGNTELAPGEKKEIVEPLPFTDRLGRNKAYLALNYGQNQAAVFDTTFYYSIPWYYLLALFGLLTIVLLFIAILFKRAFTRNQEYSDGSVYEVPLYVKNSREHSPYDHDINLKNGPPSS